MVKAMLAFGIFITHGLACYVAIDITWNDYVTKRIGDHPNKLLWEYVVRTLLVLSTCEYNSWSSLSLSCTNYFPETFFRSPARRCHSKSGAFHLSVRCFLFVGARIGFSSTHRIVHILENCWRLRKGVADCQNGIDCSSRHCRPNHWHLHQFGRNC